ncbi:hypothetical protein QBC39DRAFT_388413 [Podospora conica]|nr:hypothetical protein QBC39DRAFT_388413 [Schizothecium conicum]
MAIIIPQEYSYVLLAATSTLFVNMYHSLLTSSKRKASGIKYPTTYASQELADKDPKAFQFNCAQRAHANFTENLTPAIIGMLVTGLKYPVFAAIGGGAWSFFRAVYAAGYVANGPSGRTAGAIGGSLTDIVMKLAAAYTAVSFAMGW